MSKMLMHFIKLYLHRNNNKQHKPYIMLSAKNMWTFYNETGGRLINMLSVLLTDKKGDIIHKKETTFSSFNLHRLKSPDLSMSSFPAAHSSWISHLWRNFWARWSKRSSLETIIKRYKPHTDISHILTFWTRQNKQLLEMIC